MIAILLAGWALLGQPVRVSPGPGVWPDVAVDAARGRVLACWAAGGESWGREFWPSLAPAGPAFRLNQTTAGLQDEPTVAVARDGRSWWAWSDRSGTLGAYMGTAGRVRDGSGWVTPEILLFGTHAPGASKWRPLLTPHPAGGMVESHTSGWGEDPISSHFDPLGVGLTGDVDLARLLGQNPAGGDQAYPALAFGPHDRALAVYQDDTQAPKRLMLRRLSWALVPLGPPFPATSTNPAGDQREPRLVALRWRRIALVWQERDVDGSSWAVRYAILRDDGLRLAGPFTANVSTQGPQWDPHISVHNRGAFTLAWDDRGGPTRRIVVRAFDWRGQPEGPELVVASGLPKPSSPGTQTPPGVAVWPDGRRAVVLWQDASGVWGRVLRRVP